MTESKTRPELVDLQPATVAIVRETVPMNAMAEFFGRAFGETMAVAQAQGVDLAGPPLAVYFSMPAETADVGGGFPTARPVEASGSVTSEALPGGRAAQMVHVGSYDTLAETYDVLVAWMDEHQLRAKPVMWEIYLTEPDDEHPENTLTQIVWPIEQE